jgi:hypothetical protein
MCMTYLSTMLCIIPSFSGLLVIPIKPKAKENVLIATSCFTFYKEVAFTEIHMYYHAWFQNPKSSGNNVAVIGITFIPSFVKIS